MTFQRIILIIADGWGLGPLPDASEYGDTNAATLPHVSKAANGLDMYTCGRLGLGNLADIDGIPSVKTPSGAFGRLARKSPGTDCLSGVWEILGAPIESPLPAFADGLPPGFVSEFERQTAMRLIGNKMLTVTEAIGQFAGEHFESGGVIAATSPESAVMLAAHQNIVAAEHLYGITEAARRMLEGETGVGRVVAIPLTGEFPRFKPMAQLREYVIQPPSPTLLDHVAEKGLRTLVVGKLADLLAGQPVSDTIHTANRRETAGTIIEVAAGDTGHELIICGYHDADPIMERPPNVINMARGLEDFDVVLEEVADYLRADDLLLVTSHRGLDPTLGETTKYTREFAPLLAYGPKVIEGVSLGTLETLCDIATGLAELLAVEHSFVGTSFARGILA